MKNRLNIEWQGKRTTARFPEELWTLARAVYDGDEELLTSDLMAMTKANEKPEMANYSASGIVRQGLQWIIYNCIQLTKDQREMDL